MYFYWSILMILILQLQARKIFMEFCYKSRNTRHFYGPFMSSKSNDKNVMTRHLSVLFINIHIESVELPLNKVIRIVKLRINMSSVLWALTSFLAVNCKPSLNTHNSKRMYTDCFQTSTQYVGGLRPCRSQDAQNF